MTKKLKPSELDVVLAMIQERQRLAKRRAELENGRNEVKVTIGTGPYALVETDNLLLEDAIDALKNSYLLQIMDVDENLASYGLDVTSED